MSMRLTVNLFFLSMRDFLDLILFFRECYFNSPVHGFFQVSYDRLVSEYTLTLLERAPLK